MKKNFFIVANPANDSKKLEYILRELIDFLSSRNHKYEVFLTAKSQDAEFMVKKNLTDKFTDLIIIGGDGTINNAINGLKKDVPVSFIPNGSANDFVKNIAIGVNLEEHLKVIEEGKVISIDLGTCNGRKFINGVGIGFDGQIVADMQSQQSPVRGPLKYYYFVLKILASYQARKFTYTRDRSEKEKDLILMCISNGTTFGGGFKLTPDAEINDGILDVCEIGPIKPFKRFLNIHRLRNGTHEVLKEVRLTRCMHIKIEENPHLHAHMDGEHIGHPPFDIHILPHALRIRIKPD